VKYREFVGSTLWFWFLCLSIFGIPLALLYLIDRVVEVEEEVDDPERMLKKIRWVGP
jgi:hypothetical protein